MAYSFYGGKEGRSFTIVQRYDSVTAMVTAFARGGAYTDVSFGEFVIIDTDSKSNYENGCVYRRGFDYNEVVVPRPDQNDTERASVVSIEGTVITVDKRIYWEDTWHSDGTRVDGNFKEDVWTAAKKNFLNQPGGGAEYVGQIVGPQGGSADIEGKKWSDFIIDYNTSISGKKGEFYLDSTPGYDGSTFNDNIKFGYCVIENLEGEKSTAIISFDIPYTVFDIEGSTGSAYGPTIRSVESLPVDPELGVYYKVTGIAGYKIYDTSINEYVSATPWTVDANFNYDGLVRKEAISDTHPYYQKIDITIPKGKNGNSISSFGLTDDSQFYYDVIRYDRLSDGDSGTPERRYLDNYLKSIRNITDNSQDIMDLPVLERDTEYLEGERVRVNGNSNISLIALTSGRTQVAAAGLPDLTMAVQGTEFTDGTVIWQITAGYVISPNLLNINYTHGNADNIPFRVLNDIQIEGDGRIYAQYSDVDNKIYLGKNQSITALGYNDDPRVARFFIIYNTYARNTVGEVIVDNTFIYNSDNTDVVKFPTTDDNGRKIQYIDQRIKFISNVYYDANHHLMVSYNTSDTPTDLGLFKSINRMFWDDNFQLVVEYTDGSTETVNNFSMKYIDSITMANEGDISKSQNLIANYVVGKKTDGTNKIESEPINTVSFNNIVATSLLGDNLIVLYSDPAVRAAIPVSQRASAVYKGVTYNDWLNLGSILKGNHVFGVFPALTTPDGKGLKDLYPFGFGKDVNGNSDPATINFMGWVALVEGVDSKDYYAFDYNDSQDWSKIESTRTVVDPRNNIIVSEADEFNRPVDGNEYAGENTIWFIVEDD